MSNILLNAHDLKKMKEFEKLSIVEINKKIKAIEKNIRKHTNNNFQNINVRFVANIKDNKILIDTKHIKTNDTIQISKSKFNNGVFVVVNNENCIEVDSDLFDEQGILITKVQYPEDVQEGCLEMLKWKETTGKKAGISSETLSRHTVSYINANSDNTLKGYPISLISFLEDYDKARF